MDSYFTRDELEKIGFKKLGQNVSISKKSSLYAVERIEIGSHVRIDDFTLLSGGRGIIIGDYVHIAPYSALYGKNGIVIGSDVNISSRVSIYSNSDDYSGEYLAGPLLEQEFIHDIGTGKEIVIENHVIIGAGSILLPGSIIRQGVAVGAMSLVKQELLPFKIYGGIPVKCLKERSRKMLEKINFIGININSIVNELPGGGRRKAIEEILCCSYFGCHERGRFLSGRGCAA